MGTLLVSCGGGSTGTPPPQQGGTPSQVVVTAGDGQNGVPGEILPFPVAVTVRDALGLTLANVTVNFSTSNGAQTFPTSVVTGSNGTARALVRLPTIPFTKVTVTATVLGLNATFSATTGPKLLSTFGNVSAAHGVVRPDGIYVGLSNSIDYLPGLGADEFATDGSFLGRLGPPQGKLGLPGLYDDFWSAVAIGNNAVYFRSVLSFPANTMYIVKLDSALSLVQFTDLARSTGVGDFFLTGPMTLDPAGNIYVAMNNSGTVLVFDSVGNKINQILVSRPVAGLAINGAGNLVAFVSNPNSGFSFEEYSMAGNLVNMPSTQPFSDLATFAQDPSGGYLVLDNVGLLYRFNQNYQLVSAVAPPPNIPGFGSAQVMISGADAAGNSYLSSNSGFGLLKLDPTGQMLAVTGWPIGAVCNGCPPIAFVNQLTTAIALAVDPVTSDMYVADSSSSLQMGPSLVRFVGGQFASRLNMPPGDRVNDVAVGTARELYVADYYTNTVHVLDFNGNELQTLSGPQIGIPGSIAIDAADNKYIYDVSSSAIHVFDSNNQPIKTLQLNVAAPASGTIRIDADGTLMFTAWLNNQRTVEKIATDGTVLFSVTFQTSTFVPSLATSDSQGNIFLAGGGQVKVLDPNGKELGQFDVNASNIFPCGLARQGDTVYVCYLNRIIALAAQ